MDRIYPILSPLQEMAAYEALWDSPSASFRTISEQLTNFPMELTSTQVAIPILEKYKKRLLSIVKEIPYFDVRIYGDGEYPKRLTNMNYFPKIFYCQGNWSLSYLPSTAVVGSENPSKKEIEQTKRVVSQLVKDQFAIVSGLKPGVSTIAHRIAIEEGGFTIGILSSPLNHFGSIEIEELQKKIGQEHLLVSPVPFCRYAKLAVQDCSLFVEEQTKMMTALAEKCIRIEETYDRFTSSSEKTR